MYFLWVILSRDKEGKPVRKLLGMFPPSPYWTEAWRLAADKYGEEFIEYDFTSVTSNDTVKITI